jgi:two-component system OmpR family sensor kinase/two-component system sensor histidine kinase QseC
VSHDRGAPLLLIDDNGPGIPAAERERVFDRFWRRGDSDQSGTGLGLAIVRSVALRHSAELMLDDSPLGGLRVRLRLPKTTTGDTNGQAQAR